jgi:uncharacterized Zn finger protein
MSERKCPECGGKIDFVEVKKRGNGSFILFFCTKCGRVYTNEAFKQKI